MSWKTRENRRRTRMKDGAVAKSRRKHSKETAARWFLTVAREKTACATCGRLIPVSGEMVYRHEPREWRCLRCANRRPDSKGYRVSVRWERARADQRKAA